MKVTCIFITLNRPEITLRTIAHNFANYSCLIPGEELEVILIDNGSHLKYLELFIAAYPWQAIHCFEKNIGIAAAINQGILMAEGSDAVVTLANDILLPFTWMDQLKYYSRIIYDSGIIGIHCTENLPPLDPDGVHTAWNIYGNVLITREALNRAGFMAHNYGPYGMDDADYCYRVYRSGLKNFYLPHLKSDHIGGDSGSSSAYRKMKDKSLASARETFTSNCNRYNSTGIYYVPYQEPNSKQIYQALLKTIKTH